MEVYGYVYMVKNLVNGKIYFGITVNDFDTRYKGDITHTHNDHLKRSIEKYGIENFEINKEFDVAYNEDDLWDLEDMYICLYNTLDSHYGYNKRRSGKEHKGYGKVSEETKSKMSESRKGEKHHMYGKQLSEEQKQKISEAMKGEKHPNYGKQRTEESKRKQSKTLKGTKHSKETKQKMSETRKGHKPTNIKKVFCVETKQVFDSIEDANKWYQETTGGGRIASHIGECCQGKRKSTGKHPETGEPLRWMYYDEYLEKESVA